MEEQNNQENVAESPSPQIQQYTRTATDVLLSVEKELKILAQKVDTLFHIAGSNDMNNKILSNKISHIINTLTSMPITGQQPNDDMSFPEVSPYSMAIAPPSFQGQVSAEQNNPFGFPKETGITMETEPVGFRRTGRPETYAASSVPSPPQNKNVPTPSNPQPKMNPPKSVAERALAPGDRVPVQQKCVDAKSKAIFMASVEIINPATNAVIEKTRTNAVGKWSASLPHGKYKVNIKKMGEDKKSKVDVSQELVIDDRTPNDLPMIILT